MIKLWFVLAAAVVISAPAAGAPSSAAMVAPAMAAPALGPAIARAAGRAGQWQAAARLWRALTITQPRNGEAWAGLGHALLALDQPADAVDALARAAALQAGSPALWLDRGRAALATGDAAAARAAFTALGEMMPGDPRAWTGLGIAHDLVGAHADAQLAYAQALTLDPLNAAARHNRGLSAEMAVRQAAGPAGAATP